MTSEFALTTISLGAGVQSTVMALMAARGEITPMPDAAIFSDTGWEPKAVYEHLDWLETQLPFPVHRVSNGNLREHTIAASQTKEKSGRFATVPWFTASGGMGKRQCTHEFKIVPIERKVRELLGYEKGQVIKGVRAEQWIGISWDEIQRMKPSRTPWIEHRWPLIDLQMTRTQCLAYFDALYPGRALPKSSCLGCPFHSDHYWTHLKRNSPIEFADAVEVDAILRANGPLRGMENLQYMHRSCKPLDEVVFKDEYQYDLFSDDDSNAFIGECEGMCGV